MLVVVPNYENELVTFSQACLLLLVRMNFSTGVRLCVVSNY